MRGARRRPGFTVNSRRASRFSRRSAEVIHFDFQSPGSSRPIVHDAGSLQMEGFPSRSQLRTFQKTFWLDTRILPE